MESFKEIKEKKHLDLVYFLGSVNHNMTKLRKEKGFKSKGYFTRTFNIFHEKNVVNLYKGIIVLQYYVPELNKNIEIKRLEFATTKIDNFEKFKIDAVLEIYSFILDNILINDFYNLLLKDELNAIKQISDSFN